MMRSMLEVAWFFLVSYNMVNWLVENIKPHTNSFSLSLAFGCRLGDVAFII